MTMALRSTPTKGMEAALGLLPLDLHISQLADISRWRTRPLVHEKWDGLGKIKNRKGHRLQRDKVLKELGLYTEDDTAKERDLEESSLEVNVIQDPCITIYTDGSKENDQVGFGWAVTYDDFIIHEQSTYLEDHATVFQAEVMAIKESMDWVRKECNIDIKKVNLFSDSQAAIQAINSSWIESKVVKETKQSVRRTTKMTKVSIQWVRGHNNNTGNELADCLAKRGARQLNNKCMIGIPKSYVKGKIKDYYKNKWKECWEEEKGMRTSKWFFPSPTTNIKKLSHLNRKMLNLYTQVTTGHGLWAEHLSKWKNINPMCNLCRENKQSSIHLWCECPSLELERRQLGEMDLVQGILKLFQLPKIEESLKKNLEESNEDDTYISTKNNYKLSG